VGLFSYGAEGADSLPAGPELDAWAAECCGREVVRYETGSYAVRTRGGSDFAFDYQVPPYSRDWRAASELVEGVRSSLVLLRREGPGGPRYRAALDGAGASPWCASAAEAVTRGAIKAALRREGSRRTIGGEG
jgi:hypothetical protein